MKRLARYICFLLVFALLLPTQVSAAESVAPRSSAFFGHSSVYLYKTSDTTFQAWFHVTAVSTMDQIGASTIKIQKSTDGISWTTIITYYSSNNPQMMDYNSTSHAACVSYIGTPGCYYRAIVTLYARNSSGVGEVTEYTSSMLL